MWEMSPTKAEMSYLGGVRYLFKMGCGVLKFSGRVCALKFNPTNQRFSMSNGERGSYSGQYTWFRT
jgi:hypothetical protein